jgi:hypothetical protein
LRRLLGSAEYELLVDHPFVLQRNFGQVIVETHGGDAGVSCLVHPFGSAQGTLVQSF